MQMGKGIQSTRSIAASKFVVPYKINLLIFKENQVRELISRKFQFQTLNCFTLYVYVHHLFFIKKQDRLSITV